VVRSDTLLVVVVASIALACGAPPAAAQDAITRVSVDSGGAQADYHCSFETPPVISADGRFVAFDSYADDLVANDTNTIGDIFVHDRVTGATVRVSVDSAGAQADGESEWPALSADGRFVAFHSLATNLVANDTNGTCDVFVHDRDPDGNGIFDEGNGVTTRVSVESGGAQGDGTSFSPTLSADGRLLTFHGNSTNLVAGDTNQCFDVFLHDRATGTTIRVNVDTTGAEANGPSLYSTISSDGRIVAFPGFGTNLVAGDTNGACDIFVHDVATGQTTRVSVDSAGVEGDDGSFGPISLSADGAIVAFSSLADNLVAGDLAGRGDVFVHDRTSGTTERVSVDSAGAEGNGDSYWPALSADGSKVVFSTYADDFCPDDTNLEEDVFVRDRTTGTTSVVSATCSGAVGTEESYNGSLSPDGLLVVFVSHGSNLVSGDTNDYSDVFVRDLSVAEAAASWNSYGSGFPGTNGVPGLTASAAPVFGTTFSIDVDNSLGAATAGLLLIGLQRASIVTGAGGTILVDVVLGQPIAIGAGGLSLPAVVPRDDALCGIAVDLQALELDPGAQHRISFTPGLELVIGQ